VAGDRRERHGWPEWADLASPAGGNI